MIVVHLKRGTSIEIPEATAVAASTFPTTPGNTPALALQVVTADGRIVAVFRQTEVGGYTVSPTA